VGINIIRSSKTTRSKASPPTEFVDPDEAKVAPSKSDVPRPTFTFGEEDIACNIDLFVDGVKRAHADDPNTCASPDSRVDNGPGYEGINDAEMRSEVASRWLNELGYLEVGTSKNNAEMTESVELTDEQVLKIALGGGHFKLYPKQNSEKIWFSGRVGSIVISSRYALLVVYVHVWLVLRFIVRNIDFDTSFTMQLISNSGIASAICLNALARSHRG
jgi:hypothetical protein